MSEKRSGSRWVVVLLLLGIFVELMVIIGVLKGDDTSLDKAEIAVLEVMGPIESSDQEVRTIRKYAKQENIKAILVRVNSPGGTVGSSQEIYEALKDARENDGKRIVVSMGDVAASGGFYIAMAGEKIFANPGTITGSIGVISHYFVVDDALRKLHLKWEVLQAGESKDIGSPLRSLKPEERKIIEGMLSDVHDQFIEAIADARGMDKAEVTKLADGRIYSGRQAHKEKLVDVLGGLGKAIDATKKLADLDEDAKVYFPKKDEWGFFRSFGEGKMAKALLSRSAGLITEYRMLP